MKWATMPKRLTVMQASIAPLTAALMIMLALLLNACERERPVALPYVSEQEVILAFGDSITFGTGAKSEESYPAVLAGLIERQVVNAGIPGDITAGGLERLPTVLEKYSPRLVLLCLGGNDFLRKKSPAETEKNLDAMLNMLREARVSVVLLGVPRPGLSLKTDPVYEKLADQHKVLLIEDLVRDVLSEKSLKSDTVHPNARGYRVMAEELAEALDKHGAV